MQQKKAPQVPDPSKAKTHQWPDTAALDLWMRDNIEGYRGPPRLSKFEGGQSNPTFRITTQGGDYVLRRKPLGPVLPSAHAVDREFRVLAAMDSAGIAVPKVRALCLDEAIIGSIFYIMDFVPGRVFWDPRLPDLSRSERAGIFDSMNDTIARIHSIDPDAIGLGDFGRKEDYLKRQIARWTRQYEAARMDPNENMERLIDWLPRHVPTEHPARVVHGDFRLDNVLIHPHEPRIVAVLDWELSTIGNPIADFAYHLMTWRFAPELFRGLAGTDFTATGIPDEVEYANRYIARSGLTPPENWDFYLVLSMFRIAAILQGIAKRAEDGTAADAQARSVGAKARPISEVAWRLASAS